MKLILGDCLDKMKEMEDNSVDAIVCDPPYELGFMGKGWDSTGITYDVEMWKECLRVLKPGGHLLSFSGTRTYHRMAVAIEDAGFEIRDMIEWIYGSGFPKSLNIGKAVDKLQGNERIFTGEIKHHAQKGVAIAEERGAVGGGAFGQAKDEEVTKGTSEYEGWGTALKPSHEPICMARKPLAEKTVAENCLKWGTGGINIDEARVGNDERTYKGMSAHKPDVGTFRDDNWIPKDIEVTVKGRFPANLIHDNSEEVRECFPETKSVKGKPRQVKNIGSFGGGTTNGDNEYNDSGNASRFFKSITYQAKASKSERNKGCEGLEELSKHTAEHASNDKHDALNSFCSECGDRAYDCNCECSCGKNDFKRKKMLNNHPTVKPIALMEYLIKMITPKGGVVLDPFMGSGSTGVACKKNGFDFIGVEMEAEYMKIAEARMEAVKEDDPTLF